MKNMLNKDEVVSQYYKLRSCNKVAELYGCSHQTILRVLQANGVDRQSWKCSPQKPKREPKYRQNVYTDDELIEAYKKYGSQTQAGKALGVSQTTIYRALKRNEITSFCAYCGKPFTAKSLKAKYCSKKCKDITFRTNNGIPCNPNPEPFHKICKVCGKAFDSFREAAVTCSAECAFVHRNVTRHSEPKNTTMVWVNEKHSQHFEYVSHKSGRITLRCKCCGSVIDRAASTVRQKNINCEHCEEAKRLSDVRQKVIGMLNMLIELKTPKKCECCGNDFYSRYHNQKYCSEKCKRKSRKNTYRKRCRDYGVYYDPSVTRAKVIKRDNGICQICGKVCDENDLRWGTLGPDFPTLDHIIPLAKGGTHTWGNVQCACAICNSDKRDLLEYTPWAM